MAPELHDDQRARVARIRSLGAFGAATVDAAAVRLHGALPFLRDARTAVGVALAVSTALLLVAYERAAAADARGREIVVVATREKALAVALLQAGALFVVVRLAASALP